jgi:hypothetical protein
MTNAQRWVLVIGVLLLCGVLGWALVGAIQLITQPMRVVNNLPGGVATQVQQIINPTPTIYPSAAAIIRQVQALARLETAKYSIEKVITAETNQGVLGPLFGDRLIFVAHGEVIAGVDLSKLREGDIVVGPDGRATVILPAPEVFVATLDNQKSYVYDRETGLLNKGEIDLETQARQVAEQEILRAALEDGILQHAQTNAEGFLRSLMLSFGYSGVTFVWGTPVPLATATPTP